MPPVYSARVVNTANAIFTVQSGSTNEAFVAIASGRREVKPASPAGRRTYLQRSTGGVTPTNATEDKYNTRSPAPVGNMVTAWATLPTLSGSILLFVALGAEAAESPPFRYPVRPHATPYLINGGQLDQRTTSTGAANFATSFAEGSLISSWRRLARRPTRAGWYRHGGEHNYPDLNYGMPVTRRSDTKWNMAVPALRSLPAVDSWVAYYGAAAPSDRLAFTAVVDADFPYHMEV